MIYRYRYRILINRWVVSFIHLLVEYFREMFLLLESLFEKRERRRQNLDEFKGRHFQSFEHSTPCVSQAREEEPEDGRVSERQRIVKRARSEEVRSLRHCYEGNSKIAFL